MSIGTRIIQLRNQKGLTQGELSGRTGLAASYVSRIENRHIEPRPNTLRKIAVALGVPVSEIFQERPAQLGTLQCVITSSGHCVMDLLHSSQGKHHQSHEESTGRRVSSCHLPRSDHTAEAQSQEEGEGEEEINLAVLRDVKVGENVFSSLLCLIAQALSMGK